MRLRLLFELTPRVVVAFGRILHGDVFQIVDVLIEGQIAVGYLLDHCLDVPDLFKPLSDFLTGNIWRTMKRLDIGSSAPKFKVSS